MKNRSFTLLALLAANDRLGQSAVHRTTLVKQAFLAETIRPLYGIWLQTFRFVRYKYGPYSDDLFDRLDTLIFNGLVEVITAERRAGQFEARYKISNEGQSLLGQFNVPVITSLTTDLIWALQALGVEKASTICKLVYQEAEFARIFAHHSQKGIGPQSKVPLPAITAANNQTFITLAALQEFQYNREEDPTNRQQLPSREVVRLFLQSLAMQVPHFHPQQGVVA